MKLSYITLPPKCKAVIENEFVALYNEGNVDNLSHYCSVKFTNLSLKYISASAIPIRSIVASLKYKMTGDIEWAMKMSTSPAEWIRMFSCFDLLTDDVKYELMPYVLGGSNGE